MKEESIKRQLEELQLIQCSLLPNEHLVFLEDSQLWSDVLNKYADDPFGPIDLHEFLPSVVVRIDDMKIWFVVHLAEEGNSKLSKPSISVKGEDISRAEQDRWKTIVAEKVEQISDSEFPAYQLISLHLLPMLHDEALIRSELESQRAEQASTSEGTQRSDRESFHVLFTSHHLISATKRRLLQQWSSSLSLNGFAKVGYPGVIYAQGERANVEEFVDNVKAMQWLALKVRFVEPLREEQGINAASEQRSWKEFQKVGEVLEEMRNIGREEYVVEMGIGSAGANTK